MNLHFFDDSIGHYSNMTADRILKIDMDNNIIINLNTQCKIKSNKLIYINYKSKEFTELFDNNIERVFIHYYSKKMQNLLKSINKDIIKIWCFWSADFYELPKFIPEIMDEFSKKSIYQKANYKWKIYSFLKETLKKIQNKEYYLHNDYIKSINQFDYFACLLETDYKNVQNICNSKMKHLPWAYLSIEQSLNYTINNDFNTGDSIMINHSASPFLNHFEVIKKIEGFEVSNKIWIPLSYGNEFYKEKLIHALNKLNLNIEIEHNFLSNEQYNTKLNEIGFAIFNNKIQQAIGNIIPLIWKGVKVFLREENSVYKDFKNLGLNIYSIETLDINSFEPLSIFEKETNRKLLKKILSDEKLDLYYKNILMCEKI